jgi:hypothetical protein
MACLINRNAPSDFWLPWSVRSCHVSRMGLSVVRSTVPRWCLVCSQQPRLRVVHCQTSWYCNPRTVGGLDRRTLQRVECVLPPLPRLQQCQQHRFLQGIESCCAHAPFICIVHVQRIAVLCSCVCVCHVLTLFDVTSARVICSCLSFHLSVCRCPPKHGFRRMGPCSLPGPLFPTRWVRILIYSVPWPISTRPPMPGNFAANSTRSV